MAARPILPAYKIVYFDNSSLQAEQPPDSITETQAAVRFFQVKFSANKKPKRFRSGFLFEKE